VAAPFLLAAVLLLAWDTARHVPFDWRPASKLAGDGPPALLKKADLNPGERFFTVDWKRDFSYDFRRPDLRDSALPNLAMLWDVEDIGGYEPARTPRYDRWLASAAPWPGDRQPWSGHFGLPFPPLPEPAALARFGDANAVAFLAPRWGVPVYLAPIGENRLGGWAPGWAPDLTANVLYRPDPGTQIPRRLSVIDVLGTRHGLTFDPADSLPALAPLIEDNGVEPEASALELDASLRVQPIDLRQSGASAPLAGLELDLPPAEQPAWVFLWSENLQEVFTPMETRGLQLLTAFNAPGEWATLRTSAGEASPNGWVRANSIEANRLELEVEWNGRGPAIVEIHDAWWPGWKAWVNGTAREVRPSGPEGEGLWRWIEVPKGTSSVILTYEPPGLRASLTMCAAGLLLLLFSGWIIDRRRPADG